MRSLDSQTSKTVTGDGADHETVQAPAISLPKGGGAIRGIGEKFAANPVTGTGSLTLPIATSPGRSGFGPALSLSYDSGSGNGSFGFGWSSSLPSITRKSDKGLPRYHDAEESDIFILSGAEDLVPVLTPDGTRFEDDTTAAGYVIHRYRPRIEGLFARIERWTNVTDHRDVHWRSTSMDNTLTLYGKGGNSRIADPDPAGPGRIFSWLISETRDDKGNAVLYEYKSEDGTGVDLTRAHERNRGDHIEARRKTNRYIKHIRYGNRVPLLDDSGRRPRSLTDEQLESAEWLFEVIFDYGEHDANAPSPEDAGQWARRDDPFSVYRAGFEVRTYRLCRRVLMFHHIPDLPTGEKGYEGLVRSTDFTYSQQDPTSARNPVHTFLRAVTQSGYKRQPAGGYLKKSLPPVEFEYSQPVVQDRLEEVEHASLENLPIGVNGSAYQWTDLHGEGIPGILTEQGSAWFYKRNLSPINVEIDNDGVGHTAAKFAPVELVAAKPNLALAEGNAQFMDLAGDGQPDLVVMDGPLAGLYEHDSDEGWQPFRPFTSRLNRDTRDPNLRFVDLDGDGHADVLISEDGAFVWHPSLAEEGFGPARRVAQALDEEKGPRLVFADGIESIYLADMSGDGLADLVRVRNSEVCYWPNLGYGRFGTKVTMDLSSDAEHPPCFDHPDQFDHKRIRLADIDGTGTTDIIYLHRDGVRIYFNQSGNSWSAPHSIRVFPRVDDLVTITPSDLLGNGTACLVWSSPLPGDARRQMRYVDLMGGQKPHLLTKVVNNLGAETRVEYAPSTKFYLQDKRDGKPWITKLPFPVHVVERVETYDHISGNRFVTRYAYHHGYFDGEEREFRGFGMVEQWDTEEFAALSANGSLPAATNLDAASHVPPVLTRTWFHTGLWLGRDHVSDFFAGLLDAHDRGEYYREPAWRDDDKEASKRLLPDTIMPPELTIAEEREACRALKGAMLRQEVYAIDGTGTDYDPFGHPYTVTEQDFAIERLQPKGGNRHGVFFTHPREAITYHYERSPADPRIQHALTLEVDGFGNVLKEAAIGYGRRQPDATLPLPADRDKQTHILVTYTESRVAQDPVTNAIDTAFDYRTPVPCESRTYELTGLTPPAPGECLGFDRVLEQAATAIPLEYEKGATAGLLQKRLIEHVRTRYRRNDLTGPLPLGELQSLALPFESYRLAFTPGLIADVYDGRVTDAMLENEGRYIHTEGDANWWIPSGRVFYSPNTADTPARELAHAQGHFFLPHRYRNPFHTSTVSTESFVRYDAHKLLMLETRDALGNRVGVGEPLPNGEPDPAKPGNDYRVLQARLITYPNRNRTEVAFDVLGMVVATAVMGKEGEDVGDLLENFDADPPLTSLQSFVADPRAAAPSLLGKTTTRIVYDLERYKRCLEASAEYPQPPFAATLAREAHFHDPGGDQTRIQISFAYSDGFGQEIQQKIQAEAGEAPQRQPLVPLPTGDIRPGDLVRDAQGEPVPASTPRRWVGSGRTVFNNKGKPVRQYEPFFSSTHLYEPEREMTDTGVSPVLFYDPVERVVATLHPNHTYEKVVFDPWQQTTFDVNDTVAANGAETGDPRTDADVKGYVAEYFKTQPGTWQAWHQERITGAQGPHEKSAAEKAAKHANTPTTAYFDTLGRPFLTLAHNGFKPDGTPEQYPARVELDIEGNQRAVRDAIVQSGDELGRIVMRYDYDMLGNRIHQASMEAGERWMLGDVTGKPIRAWDSRGFMRRVAYDELRRPTGLYVTENGAERLAERTVYGEDQGDADNHRTRIYQVFDGAGIVTSEGYDFKGNLLESRRDLLPDYKQAADWLQHPAADDGSFVTRTTYDALNRPLTVTTPDGSVYRPTFNEANLLDKVDVNLRGAAASTRFVTDIDYNAKGQRTLIRYGNGAQTTYEYDPLTFRLSQLKTIRPVGLNGSHPSSPIRPWCRTCTTPTTRPATSRASKMRR